MCTVFPSNLAVAREQIAICRHEITLGARKLRANPSPDVADCHLMADAILEYFGAELAFEAAR
jgi:hypothetical protein